MATGDTAQTIYTQFFISASTPASEDETGYEALTWTECDKLISLPERGDTQEDVTESSLSDGRVEHFNGVVDGGRLTLPFIWVEGDAGQAILLASTGGNTNYSFREVEPDGATVHSYQGRLSSPRWREATASSFKGFSVDLLVNTARTTYDISD